MRFTPIRLASMPRDITADVMKRIQTVPAPRPFRLTWTDFMLAIILSLCVGAVWFSVDHLPPLVVAQVPQGKHSFLPAPAGQCPLVDPGNLFWSRGVPVRPDNPVPGKGIDAEIH